MNSLNNNPTNFGANAGFGQAQNPPVVPPTTPVKNNAEKSKAMEKLSSFFPLIFVFAFFSVSVIAGYFAYIEYLRIPELRIEKDEKIQELDRVTVHANYLKSLESLKGRLDQNITLSEQAITPKHDIPQLMNQVILIAKNVQSSLENLVFAGSTTESTGTKTPGTINIQTTITGNYTQVTDYIKALENARRLVSIKSLKYTSASKPSTTTSNNSISTGKFIPNIDLNKESYSLTVTVSGYYLGNINTDNMDYEILVKKQNLDNVVSKLESLTWYEPTALNLEVGTSDPFKLNINDLNQNIATTSPVNILDTNNDGFAD